MSRTAVKRLYFFILFHFFTELVLQLVKVTTTTQGLFCDLNKTHFWLDWCYVLNPDMYTLTCLTVYGSLYWYFFPSKKDQKLLEVHVIMY